jgi:hypothetical protein
VLQKVIIILKDKFHVYKDTYKLVPLSRDAFKYEVITIDMQKALPWLWTDMIGEFSEFIPVSRVSMLATISYYDEYEDPVFRIIKLP